MDLNAICSPTEIARQSCCPSLKVTHQSVNRSVCSTFHSMEHLYPKIGMGTTQCDGG